MSSIPSSLTPFFQEYCLEQLDLHDAANTIIERTLRFGNRTEIQWLFLTYSREEITAWVQRWGKYGFPEHHLTFWRMVLDLES